MLATKHVSSTNFNVEEEYMYTESVSPNLRISANGGTRVCEFVPNKLSSPYLWLNQLFWQVCAHSALGNDLADEQQ